MIDLHIPPLAYDHVPNVEKCAECAPIEFHIFNLSSHQQKQQQRQEERKKMVLQTLELHKLSANVEDVLRCKKNAIHKLINY